MGNRDRVSRGFELLGDGLGPLVVRRMSAVSPARALAEGQESEQTDRVRLLAERGLLRFLPQSALTPERLAEEIDRAAAMQPPPIDIDLGGAARSAELILDAIARGR